MSMDLEVKKFSYSPEYLLALPPRTSRLTKKL